MQEEVKYDIVAVGELCGNWRGAEGEWLGSWRWGGGQVLGL